MPRAHKKAKTPTKFIVKLQVSLASNRPGPRSLLVYNEDHSIYYEGEVTLEVLDKLQDQPKGYFWAWMEGTKLALGVAAPPQEW